MSEYETASLFYEMIGVANASMANYLTVVFAVLAAGYLVAEKLDRTSAIVVLSLFTVFALGMTNEIVSAYRDFAGLGRLMAQMAAAGPAFSWHPVAGTRGAGFALIPFVVLGICAVAYVGTMWFFLHTRRTRRAAVSGS